VIGLNRSRPKTLPHEQRPIGRWQQGIVTTITIAYAAYCLFRNPPGPITTPDSAGYLDFLPIHTLGYPVFLKVLGASGAIVAQPLLFAAALACLGLETLRLTSSLTLSAATIVAVMLTPELRIYHASILTESLFVSGLLMFLASTIRFVRVPSPPNATRAAVVAGLAATVRRTGLVFLPVLSIMVLMQWRRLPQRRWPIVAQAIVPMLLILSGERLAARAIHGEHVGSLLGVHLFAKAAMIDAPPAPRTSADPERSRLENQLEVQYAPMRDLIDRAPRAARSVLTIYYESCLQARCLQELRGSMPLSEPRWNDLLTTVGFERISRAPLRFAALTATHYGSLWTVSKQHHPNTAPLLNAFIASNRPLPLERAAFALDRSENLEFRSIEPVRFIQPIVILVGWLTGCCAVLGMAAAASRRLPPPALSVAFLAALTAHAGLLLTALLAAGISRFMVSLWPAVTTATLFSLWWIVSATLSQRSLTKSTLRN
jgi:hypothetical protein